MQTLLIVDDADFMRFILRDLFTREGLATVAEAGSHDEALSLAKALHPEMAVVDTTTPGGGGLDLIREMTLSRPEMRIVAAVRAGDYEAVDAATRAGADYTLDKPYDPKDVSILMRTLQAQPQPV